MRRREIRDGYERLLNFFLFTSGTLIAARLVAIVLLGALDRSVRIGDGAQAATTVLASSGCSPTTPSCVPPWSGC